VWKGLLGAEVWKGLLGAEVMSVEGVIGCRDNECGTFAAMELAHMSLIESTSQKGLLGAEVLSGKGVIGCRGNECGWSYWVEVMRCG
jgi:hypothetical protein